LFLSYIVNIRRIWESKKLFGNFFLNFSGAVMSVILDSSWVSIFQVTAIYKYKQNLGHGKINKIKIKKEMRVKKFSTFIRESEEFEGGEDMRSMVDPAGAERSRGGLKQVSIDLGYDPSESANDFLQMLHEICEQFDLQIIGLVPYGPGGGNPEVTFRGQANDIMSMLDWYHDQTGEDVESFYDTYVTSDEPRPFEVEAKKDNRFTGIGRKFIDPSGRSKGM
jgi:hypothetical protein